MSGPVLGITDVREVQVSIGGQWAYVEGAPLGRFPGRALGDPPIVDIEVVECLDLPPTVDFIEDRHHGGRTYYIRPGSKAKLATILPAFD